MRTPSNDPPPSEITLEGLYLRRRELMRNALLFGATATTVGGSLLSLRNGSRADPREAAESAAARRQRASFTESAFMARWCHRDEPFAT